MTEPPLQTDPKIVRFITGLLLRKTVATYKIISNVIANSGSESFITRKFRTFLEFCVDLRNFMKARILFLLIAKNSCLRIFYGNFSAF